MIMRLQRLRCLKVVARRTHLIMAIEFRSWVLVTDDSAPSYRLRVGQVITEPVSAGAVVQFGDRQLCWVDSIRMTRLQYTIQFPLLGFPRPLNDARCAGNSSTSAAAATSGAVAPSQAGEATRSLEPFSCRAQLLRCTHTVAHTRTHSADVCDDTHLLVLRQALRAQLWRRGPLWVQVCWPARLEMSWSTPNRLCLPAAGASMWGRVLDPPGSCVCAGVTLARVSIC